MGWFRVPRGRTGGWSPCVPTGPASASGAVRALIHHRLTPVGGAERRRGFGWLRVCAVCTEGLYVDRTSVWVWVARHVVNVGNRTGMIWGEAVGDCGMRRSVLQRVMRCCAFLFVGRTERRRM